VLLLGAATFISEEWSKKFSRRATPPIYVVRLAGVVFVKEMLFRFVTRVAMK